MSHALLPYIRPHALPTPYVSRPTPHAPRPNPHTLYAPCHALHHPTTMQVPHNIPRPRPMPHVSHPLSHAPSFCSSSSLFFDSQYDRSTGERFDRSDRERPNGLFCLLSEVCWKSSSSHRFAHRWEGNLHLPRYAGEMSRRCAKDLLPSRGTDQEGSMFFFSLANKHYDYNRLTNLPE